MDLMTCLPETADGYDTIVVFVDRLTKYCIAVPSKLSVDAPGFAQLLIDHVISKHGPPLSIVSDRDTRFTSAFFKTLLARLDVRSCMSTSFHPQSDGQTERMNRLLQETLRHFVCYTQNDWDKHLQLACFAINNADNGSTGKSPFFLNFGRHPRHPSGILDLPAAADMNPLGNNAAAAVRDALSAAKTSLERAQLVMKRQADKHRRSVIFKVGDMVLLSTVNLRLKAGPAWARHKLLPKYIGPFRVLSTVVAPFKDPDTDADVPCAVKLDLPDTTRIHPVFNVSLLIHWRNPVDDPLAIRVPQPVDWLEGFEVSGIVGHKWVKCGKRRRLMFKVQWVGVCDDTWEPRVSLFGSIPDDVLAYEMRHADAILHDKSAATADDTDMTDAVQGDSTALVPVALVPAAVAPTGTAKPAKRVRFEDEAVLPPPPPLPGPPPLPVPPGDPVLDGKRVRTRTPRYLQSCFLFE